MNRWRQRRGTAKRKREYAAGLLARLEVVFINVRLASNQRALGTESGEYRDVLYVAHLVGNWRSVQRRLRVELPKCASVRRRIGFEKPVYRSLKHQISRRGEHAAIAVSGSHQLPGRFLRDWIPGNQVGALPSFIRRRFNGGIKSTIGWGHPVTGVDIAVPDHQPGVLHRDVCQARPGAIRHRRPAVSAADRRPDSRNRSIRELRTGRLYRASGPEVYSLGPGHLREGLGRNQLSVGSVDHVKESILRRLQQYFAFGQVGIRCLALLPKPPPPSA